MQICACNSMARRPDLLARLREHGYIIETEQCLDQCTRCGVRTFALVRGEFQFARTPDELAFRLRERIPSAGRGKT